MIGRVSLIYAVSLVFAMGWIHDTQAQTLDRGHRLLIEHGLQIQTWAFPGANGDFNLDTWAASHFTAPTFIDNAGDADPFLGLAPGIPWGTAGWASDLAPGEIPYASNLVSVQFGDEQNLADVGVLAQAVSAIKSWQDRYPHAIVFTNQVGLQFSDAIMLNYMEAAKPDMLMFDSYPFNGLIDFVPGGSPSVLYVSLDAHRKLGLAGHDGTGRRPIPTGVHVQTFTMSDLVLGHIVTESEARLNQFSAWAYGYKFINAFIYDRPATTGEGLQTILFEGPSDAAPTPLFYQIAELNRQSRNLGPALVRLLTTDIRFVLGRYKPSAGEAARKIPLFFDMQSWSAGQTVPYLTAVSASNLCTENYGLEGNVLLGGFRTLDESFDGTSANNEAYFMVVNGLSSPEVTGTAANTKQRIHLTFNFGASGLTALQRMSRDTGLVENVPLVNESGSVYSLDLVLDGGTGDLFKFKSGAPFVGDATYGGEITCSHGYYVEEGKRITFNAIIGGRSYEWLRNGVALIDDERIQGSTTNMLTLDPADVEDAGVYVCRIGFGGPLGPATSTPHEIMVVLAGQLPAASASLVALGVLMLGLIGQRQIRRYRTR